jgi:hypothetical protein
LFVCFFFSLPISLPFFPPTPRPPLLPLPSHTHPLQFFQPPRQSADPPPTSHPRARAASTTHHPESSGPHGLVWHNGKYVHQRELDGHGSTGVQL